MQPLNIWSVPNIETFLYMEPLNIEVFKKFLLTL